MTEVAIAHEIHKCMGAPGWLCTSTSEKEGIREHCVSESDK